MKFEYSNHLDESAKILERIAARMKDTSIGLIRLVLYAILASSQKGDEVLEGKEDKISTAWEKTVQKYTQEYLIWIKREENKKKKQGGR